MSKKFLKPLVGSKFTGSAAGQDAVVNDYETIVAGSSSDVALATSSHAGSGKGCAVTKNSASVAKGKHSTARVSCISGYAGPYDHVRCGNDLNLVSTNLVHPPGLSGKRPRVLVGVCRTSASDGRLGAPIRADDTEEASR